MATRWNRSRVLLVMVVCLSFVSIFELYQNTTKEISRFSNMSTDPLKYLDKDCYHYDNFKARFICDGPYFNFTKERIFDCAWKLWNARRNPKEDDPWQNKRAHANVSASEVAKRPSIHIMIVGDSHLRFILDVFVKRIADEDTKYKVGSDNKWKEIEIKPTKEKNFKQIIHLDVPLKITYKWDPFLKTLPSTMKSWIAGEEPRPTFLIFGTALHYMRMTRNIYKRFGDKRASKGYAQQLRVLAPLVKEFSKTTISVFKLMDYIQKHTENVFAGKNTIDFYNDIARETLGGDHLILWDSAQPLSDLYNEECEKHERNTPETYMWICNDIRHIGYIMNDQYLDMYLHTICNKLDD